MTHQIDLHNIGYNMKFKDYIQITEKTHETIFQKMRSGDIPLTPKMLERIFPKNTGYFFHVTDLTNKKRLEKLQKTKKQVSCFTDFYNYEIFGGADGIDYDYPCTFILEGNYTFGSSEDVYTEPDDGGRRWIQYYEIMDSESSDIFKDVSDYIIEIFSKSKFGKEFTKDQIDALFYEPQNLNGKTKALVIKTYMDSAEKALLKYKDDIIDSFGRETSSYNEVMGYNFIIKEIMMDIDSAGHYLHYEMGWDHDDVYDEDGDDMTINFLTDKAQKYFKKNKIQIAMEKNDIAKYLQNFQ